MNCKRGSGCFHIDIGSARYMLRKLYPGLTVPGGTVLVYCTSLDMHLVSGKMVCYVDMLCFLADLILFGKTNLLEGIVDGLANFVDLLGSLS